MIPTAASIGLLLSVIAYLLSQLGFRGVRAFGALGIAAVLLLVASSAGGFLGELGMLFDIPEVESVTKAALKIVFVGYVFGFCTDVSAQLGEFGISSAVAIGGRIEMMLIALPYIKDIINLAMELVR